jgi:hypothetical protein
MCLEASGYIDRRKWAETTYSSTVNECTWSAKKTLGYSISIAPSNAGVVKSGGDQICQLSATTYDRDALDPR